MLGNFGNFLFWKSADTSQERKLCTDANRGICRYQDDTCKDLHKRCQNYDSCSQSDCRLAHAPRETPPSSPSVPPKCLSGINCFKLQCQFQHPDGWSVCSNGTKCAIYECKSNHSPGRTPKCFNEDHCTKKSCTFLHPRNSTSGRAHNTPHRDKNFEKLPSTEYARQSSSTLSERRNNKKPFRRIQLTHAKFDYIKLFGGDVLSTIRKQCGVDDIKVQDGELRVFGDSADIENIESYIDQALYEQTITIRRNLMTYLQRCGRGCLLKKFKNKYRISITVTKISSEACSNTKKLVTIRNPVDDHSDDDDDDDDDSSDENDSDHGVISIASSNITTTQKNVGRRSNRAQNLKEISLCSKSQDSLSKAIKELKGYTLYNRKWALTQDEIAYILKQPRKKGKERRHNGKTNNTWNIINHYLFDLIQSSRNCAVQIFVHPGNGSIHVTVRGFKDHVENAVSKIKASLADNVQSEIQFPLSREMAVFLRTKASSYIRQLEKTQRIKLINDNKKNEDDSSDCDCLKLIGSNTRINSAKAKVEDFLESLCEKEEQFPCETWDMSKNILQILRRRGKEIIGSADYEAIWWTKSYTETEQEKMKPNVTLLIVGFNEKVAKDLVEEAENIVSGYVIWKPSEEDFRGIYRALIVKKSPSIDEFRQQWDVNIQLNNTTNIITIPAGSKMIADDIRETLLSLGTPQVKRIVESISIEPQIRRFVNKSIHSLLNEAKSQKVIIESNRSGLKLRGPSNKVTQLKENINSIIDTIRFELVAQRFQFSSVESDLFRSNGYKSLALIEQETNTIIRDTEIDVNNSMRNLNLNDDDNSLNITCVVNNRGQSIIVRKGDITKEKSLDAIVNSTNGQLYHAGGIDKTIADAAGPALDHECRGLIAKNNGLPFPAGQAVKTTAGNLPFKCVIHAIAPQFIDGNHQERSLLFFSILSSLRLADKEQYKTIALPAVSSHTYDFPLEDCINIVVRAVKQFFADYPQSTVEKVILLDINEATCNSFAREVVVDHRGALEDDDDVLKYKLEPLTAKWCWKNEDGERIYDDNHTRQIETAFQHYLKTDTMPTLIINPDNLRSGTLVNYSIHFLPDLRLKLTSTPSILNGRLVCGYQKRQNTGYEREIIRYPVMPKSQSTTTVNYSPKPLDLYHLHLVIDKDEWEIIGITNSSINQAKAAMDKAIEMATISEQYSVNLDKDIDKHKEQIKCIATEQYIQIHFGQQSSGQLSMTLKGLKVSVQDAKLKITLYAHDILKKYLDNDNELDAPNEWGDQTENLKIIEIPRNNPSFTRIENRMKETLPNVKIEKIERIQNLRLWSHYANRRREMKNDLSDTPNLQIEKELFHGTRTALPTEVYDGDCGFDMRFSTSGMWGIGSYFAQNASYSCSGYAHTLPNGKRQVFLAQILTGDVHNCPSNSNLRMPPKKNKSSGSSLRYNSVSGVTGGSQVYIVYENRVAYPTYLITFTL